MTRKKTNDFRRFSSRSKWPVFSDAWKSSSNFELLSNLKYLYYILQTLGTSRSIIWLNIAQFSFWSGSNCSWYSSFGGITFFCHPVISYFCIFYFIAPSWGEFDVWIPVPTCSPSGALIIFFFFFLFARYLYEPAITNSLPQWCRDLLSPCLVCYTD